MTLGRGGSGVWQDDAILPSARGNGVTYHEENVISERAGRRKRLWQFTEVIASHRQCQVMESVTLALTWLGCECQQGKGGR